MVLYPFSHSDDEEEKIAYFYYSNSATMKFEKATLVAVFTAAAHSAMAWAPVHNNAARNSMLQAATLGDAPVREAPGAGWEPEWEDRAGLTPEEFMASDMSKPDLSGMWECPLTRWDSDK